MCQLCREPRKANRLNQKDSSAYAMKNKTKTVPETFKEYVNACWDKQRKAPGQIEANKTS